MGATCTKTGLAQTQIDALKSGIAFKTNGMIEDVVKLHMELVALAFACNFNRVATLQWATAPTTRNTACRRTPAWAGLPSPEPPCDSDGATASNPTAEAAHAEVDKLRMQSLLYGLDAFKARGLQDKAIVMWTNHVATAQATVAQRAAHHLGQRRRLPEQGQYIDAGNVTNNKLFNTLITAAIRDKSTAAVNFGAGPEQAKSPDEGVISHDVEASKTCGALVAARLGRRLR
jgi:hypothetical protein